MTSDELKRAAAEAALEYVPGDEVIGVGTGSTVRHFIELLAGRRDRVRGAVSSSEETTRLLGAAGIPVVELNDAGTLPVYVDGADEATRHLHLVKGGGGALTREKVIASASDRFVCIADESKLVRVLGRFPLPVEVIPMARSYVSRELVRFGGRPRLREGYRTDNGNEILDVHDLDIGEPARLEQRLNDIPGIVTVGIFALRPADLLLLAGPDGVRRFD
ncbi:MAG TPA: ribose-5-phosphate isomerase RpiA [Gammaproteobacteria bacterium]|nr:ribose-5-phosphate isomerase RpiA [Gammaproteobacteria bacterium]